MTKVYYLAWKTTFDKKARFTKISPKWSGKHKQCKRHSVLLGRTTQRTQGVLDWGWPLLVQRGPLDPPQWGCNLGAMGTDVGAEVTECPSAGEWTAD